MSHEKYKKIGTPLAKAVEECAEFIKAACKIDRFGWNKFNPDDPKAVRNDEHLRQEMDDVVEAMERLEKWMSRGHKDKKRTDGMNALLEAEKEIEENIASNVMENMIEKLIPGEVEEISDLKINDKPLEEYPDVKR